MRYCQWSVYFPNNDNEGITPESIIVSRGGLAEGAIALDSFTIIGYVSDNADLSNLDDFKIKKLTAEEALIKAQEVNPSYYLQNGYILKNETNIL